jgi:hypothetical protein
MYMRHLVFVTLFLSIFMAPTGAQGAPAQSEAEALEYLQELGTQTFQRMQALDQEIKALLVRSHNTELSPQLDPKTLPGYSNEIERLSLQRREFVLRQNFIDRLKFHIDQNYRGGDFKDFLSKTILGMAQTEALDLQGDQGFTKFCNYLSLAVREIPERNENLLAFIEGYMKFSSILNPRPPNQYVEHRSYTNGFDSYSAQTRERDTVGDIVEERLALIKNQDQMAKKTFETGVPVLKPLTATLSATSDATPPSGYRVSDPVTSQLQGAKAIEDLPKLKAETEAQSLDVAPAGDANPLQLRIHMKDIHKPTEEKAAEAAPSEPVTAPKTEY